MRKKQILLATLVACLPFGLGLVSAGSAQQPQRPGKDDSADVITPESPKLLWSDERIISAKIPGRIARRLVNDGAAVEEGQVLAELDFREAELENERQQIVAASPYGEEIARETAEEYRARDEANERLVRSRAIPAEEHRLGKVQVRINDAKVKQEAEKTVLEKNKAAQTEIVLDEHFIRSPIKGRVQKCFKRPGESVTPNDLQLFRIVATDKLWVEGLIPDRYAFTVQEGQRVTVQLVFRGPPSDFGPGGRAKEIQLPQSHEIFEGKIVFIDTDVDPNSHKFWVRAEVENRKEILRAGFECTMKIYPHSLADTATDSN